LKPISAATEVFIDNLLLQRVSLAGIVRVTGVSAQWLQDYVIAKYATRPQVMDIPAQKRRADLEYDELWSFIGSKASTPLGFILFQGRSGLFD
jgi:insertion element IS1 protein InsB